MVWDYSKLKGKIKEVYGTQDNFAKAIGISRVSLSLRLNNNLEFSQNEMARALLALNADQSQLIDFFYTPKAQKDEQ